MISCLQEPRTRKTRVEPSASRCTTSHLYKEFKTVCCLRKCKGLPLIRDCEEEPSVLEIYVILVFDELQYFSVAANYRDVDRRRMSFSSKNRSSRMSMWRRRSSRKWIKFMKEIGDSIHGRVKVGGGTSRAPDVRVHTILFGSSNEGARATWTAVAAVRQKVLYRMWRCCENFQQTL